MRTREIRIWMLVVAFLLSLALAGCGPANDETPSSTAMSVDQEATQEPTDAPAEPTEVATNRVLRTALLNDISTFDPDNGFEVAGLGEILAVYEGLVEYEPESTELTGLLAEDWSISDDGLTYTFDLHDDVIFHDGTSMTSAEVKAAFERRADESMVLSYFLWNVASMEAPDEHTFVITLGTPQPSFIHNLASPWGPKVVGPGALVENAGEDNAVSYLNERADGTGPFVLKEFNRGESYMLERFEDYWGDAPFFHRIEVKVIPDIGQQILQLQNGDIDLILHGYPFPQLGQLPEGLETYSYNDLGLEMAYVNTSGVLSDPALRQAVKTAINPEDWVEDAFYGFATPAKSLYPKAMLTPESPLVYPTDIAAAQAAVEATGNVEIEISYAVEEAGVQQRVADLLIAELAGVGIDATARAVPMDETYAFHENLADAPDLYLVQNNPDSAHPETMATLFYATDAPLNIFGYSNEEADELIYEAGTLTDTQERDQLYEEAGELLFEDGAFLPLADVLDVIVHRSSLTNFGSRPAVPWNIDFAMVREE